MAQLRPADSDLDVMSVDPLMSPQGSGGSSRLPSTDQTTPPPPPPSVASQPVAAPAGPRQRRLPSEPLSDERQRSGRSPAKAHQRKWSDGRAAAAAARLGVVEEMDGLRPAW